MRHKNYQNWLRFAKLAGESLLPHFYGPQRGSVYCP